MIMRREAVIKNIPRAISPGDSLGIRSPIRMENTMTIIMSQIMMIISRAVNATVSREETPQRVSMRPLQ